MADTREYLDKEFRSKMPCVNCALSSICKHSFAIQRPNFNPSVFDLRISCKIQDETVQKIVDASNNAISIGVE